jgi:hypothetical protein
MRGRQGIQSAADTSDVDTRMMHERLQQRQQEQLGYRPDEFQQRFDALLERRQQEPTTVRPPKEPTTVRPPPKPQGKKFSPKIPIGKKGATLQPTKMGKGVGGGVKATVKFK